MSEDTYYLIRKHPNGKFAAIFCFASLDFDANDPSHLHNEQPQFDELDEALEFAHAQELDGGVEIHDECLEEEDLQRPSEAEVAALQVAAAHDVADLILGNGPETITTEAVALEPGETLIDDDFVEALVADQAAMDEGLKTNPNDPVFVESWNTQPRQGHERHVECTACGHVNVLILAD